MRAMAPQITRLKIVYSTVYLRHRSKQTSKLRVTGICEGNSPVTGKFPTERTSDAEIFPFDDVIMIWNENNYAVFLHADDLVHYFMHDWIDWVYSQLELR